MPSCPYAHSNTPSSSTPASADDVPTGVVASPAPSTPYAPLPTAYMPADSQIPPTNADRRSPALHSALRQTATAFTSVVERMQRHVTSPAQLQNDCTALRAHVDAILHELVDTYTTLQSTHDRPSSEDAVRAAIQSRDDIDPSNHDALHADFNVQDLYFQIFRVPDPSFDAYVAQMAVTTGRIVSDLPHTTLALDEVTALLRASGKTFDELAAQWMGFEGDADGASSATTDSGANGRADSSARAVAPATLPPLEDLDAYWTSHNADPKQSQTRQVALYRWINGHHIWKLYLQFIGDHLRDAEQAVDADAVTRAATSINEATTYLRGTPAAMWYAANSPSVVYRDKIRPSMVNTAQSVGAESFSGVQNADHTRVQSVWDALLDTTRRVHGASPQDWPTPLREAIRSYHQTDVQSEEHHVQIAFSKVGTSAPSLAQQMKQAHLPDTIRPMSAVEVLRNMVDAKRAELDL